MSYNKSVVAAGFAVGLVVITGILQLRFYFNPPEDHFADTMDTLLKLQTESVVDTTDTFTADSVAAVAVTPTVVTESIYQVAAAHDLAAGIPLAVLTQTDGVLVASLRGSSLYLLDYDLAWQLRESGEHLIQTDVALVHGQPPLAVLTTMTDGYRVILQTNTDVQIITLDQTFAVQHVASILATPQGMAATEETLWINTDTGRLQIYNLNPTTMMAEQSMDPVICSLMAGQTNAVTVQPGKDQLTLTKVTAVGTDSAAVVAWPGVGDCTTSAHTDDLIALTQPAGVVMLSADLATQYPVLDLPDGALFSQLGFDAQHFWVLYSTSETLGEYTMHVATFLPVTAAQPDVTDVYTN